MGRLASKIVSAVAILAAVADAGRVQNGKAELLARQNQRTFPAEMKGPCRQDDGQPPFSCADKECLGDEAEGRCKIYASNKVMTLCSCCPADKPLVCSECGGDAGGGKCVGNGLDQLAYKDCACGAQGGSGNQSVPLTTLSLAAPLVGFPPPPPGTPKPKEQCSAIELPKCRDCNGKQGWCQDGDHVGCQCHEECTPDNEPACKDEACKGNDDNKCTQGPQKDCSCKAEEKSSSGNLVVPLAILPFAAPLVGFPPPPPGTPKPKEQCSAIELPKCRDCNGKQGWCQNGEHVGCQCHEECTPDNEPACKDEACKGNDDNKCTEGPQKDCSCKAEEKCKPDEEPSCKDEACKGNDDNKCTQGPKKDCSCIECPKGEMILADSECKGEISDNKCTCKGLGPKTKDYWKGCDCWDSTPKTYPNRGVTVAQFWAAQESLKNLLNNKKGGVDPNNVTCWDNSAEKVSGRMLLKHEMASPNQLSYILRDTICNGKCEVPDRLDSSYVKVKQSDDKNDCEISVALINKVEAYFSRKGAPEGWQQQCWNSTDNIVKKCIKNGPNKGWWNGAPGQFYEAGFRPLNGKDSLHEPFPDGGPVLYDALPAIVPMKEDGSIDCLTNPTYTQASIEDCSWKFGEVDIQGQKFDANQQICTKEPQKNCLKSGDSFNDKGEKTGTWCVVAESGSCAFVIADKSDNGGSCISGDRLWKISDVGSKHCSIKGGRAGVFAAGPGGRDQTLCMVNKFHPEVCGVRRNIFA